mgnify:CR=1 FL=1
MGAVQPGGGPRQGGGGGAEEAGGRAGEFVLYLFHLSPSAVAGL